MSRKTGPSKAQAELVVARSGGVCEAWFFDGCNGRAEQLHHRRPRGMGGSKRSDANSPAVLVHICWPCHVEIESHRAYARDRGLLISALSGVSPSCVPVWRRGVLVLLDDWGGVHDQSVTF